ncbi:MAG: hypothetical protein KDA60_18465 [Planctomycetales bacterium]|nr:hypothetical protein [Planctomycetales bacterium]
MAKASWLRFLGFGSSPKAPTNILLRDAREQAPHRVVQIGLSPLDDVHAFITECQHQAGEPVSFVGIDWFEAANTERPLSLKEAHRKLGTTHAHVRLLPGSVADVLPRVANDLLQTDWVIVGRQPDISPCYDDMAAQVLWKYLPRMLHAGSRIYLHQFDAEGATDWRILGKSDLPQPFLQHRRAA